MERKIALDTETTGLRIADGHRVIEIGCVEIIGREKTGRYFHSYINPERDVDVGAFGVHGLSKEFLADKPKFKEIAKDFYDFIQDSKLIIHNAPFDVKFLNNEFALLEIPFIKQHNVLDTLLMARKKYPGSPASLDALCKRFKISLENREKHGALVDADLLASVYFGMQGVVQGSIDFCNNRENLSESYYGTINKSLYGGRSDVKDGTCRVQEGIENSNDGMEIESGSIIEDSCNVRNDLRKRKGREEYRNQQSSGAVHVSHISEEEIQKHKEIMKSILHKPILWENYWK